MIDFHTHILPFVDDGAKSIEESKKLLSELKLQNIDTVVLTPHFYSNIDSPQIFADRRDKSFLKLLEYKDDSFPRLVLGAEIQFFTGISLCDNISELTISDSDYLLIEMPFCKWNNRMTDELYALKNKRGYNIILAHIERYIPFFSNEMLDELISEGIIIQSNADFFNNRFSRKKALRMLTDGKIHILGSDCHNMSDRKPNIKKACEIILNKAGKEYIDKIDLIGKTILFSE